MSKETDESGNNVNTTDAKEVYNSNYVRLTNNHKTLKLAIFQLTNIEVFGEHWACLFDCGSDLTYVSSSLVKKTKPAFNASKKIGYAPLGGGKTKPVDRCRR